MGGCDQDLLLPLDVEVTEFCEGAVVAVRRAVLRHLESLALPSGVQNCAESKDVLCLPENVGVFLFFFWSSLDPFMAIFRAK